jgi:toxin ParE1/3/4
LPTVLRSDLAEDDLVEIWLFIAKDSPNAADRFLDLLDQKCQLLAESPEIGRRRPELAPACAASPSAATRSSTGRSKTKGSRSREC